MSGYPARGRSGKATMALGVICIVAGFALRVILVNQAANAAPPQFWAQSQSGNGLLMLLAWLLVVAGLVLTVVGAIRYAQSGQTVYLQSPAHSASFAVPATAAPERPAEPAPVRAAPAFCSSCGAGVVGAGRFCASCGEPIAR